MADLVALLPDWRKPLLMREFGAPFTAAWGAALAPLSIVQRKQFAVAFLAEKALEIGKTLADKRLTRPLLARYPRALERLADTLESPPESYDLQDELFIKDLRLVLGLGLPAGASILDIRSRLGGTALLGVARRNPLWVARTRGQIPCFRLYIDPRYLEDFNRDGMAAYYREAGELLMQHPDVYGFICKSWFMDPQLEQVSPRLGHLSSVPLSAGAFVINSTPTAKDIERATKTSPTRRSLYESGAYRPQATTLVWPRKGMIAWAKSQIASGA
ncbi:hypothetical protein [Sphingobium aromaticiconvertens]|uniref:hypothetical protein n=1 Tax=Sphingobium aromaticiconvertens TaxID=365341 RepID=UPI003017B5A5